ncbi:MAG TPA: PilN domain-containing protein [Tepidisphaeraceae bacterium]|jgi:Tfp pilus assembly protein PilN
MSAPNQLSFLPDDYLERKAQRRMNILCGSLSAVVAIAIFAAVTISKTSMHTIEAEHTQVEQEYALAARKIAQVQQMQEQQRTMQHQADITASLLERVPRSNLLAEITNSMPASVSLLDFVLDAKKHVNNTPAPANAYEQKKAEVEAKKKAAIAEPQVFDVSMKMTGVAATDLQVAQLISKLLKSKLLKDVNLVVSEEYKQGDEKLRKFQIEMMLDPSAEVQPAAEAGKTASVELGR